MKLYLVWQTALPEPYLMRIYSDKEKAQEFVDSENKGKEGFYAMKAYIEEWGIYNQEVILEGKE